MEDDSKAIEVIRLFKEVAIAIRHTMTRGFDDSKMTAPQGMIIGTLSKFGKMKVSDLSDKLGFSNSTVSGILDRLEKQEMVKRIRSEEDRRVVYVQLSDKFEEIHKDFHKKSQEHVQKIMSRGTPEDIEKIIEGLNTIKKLLKDDNTVQ